MKNYNKILEAVNRGIKFALDDFESDEEIQSQVNSKVKYQGGMKEYLDLMKDVVDLGLPSGTLWCKYNLGVDPNLLAKPEDWYGKYYAWGELEGNKTNKNGKIYFNKINYKFGKSSRELTKYCNNPKNGLRGFTDNLTELQPEDDAAYLNKKFYNYKFHIPSKELCEELLKYTNSYWIKNYDPNKIKHNPEDDDGIQGLNGRIFEGKNRKQLFIPAAGEYYNSHILLNGSYCYLWSSDLSLVSPWCAHHFDIYSSYTQVNIIVRWEGCSIRPVINF